MTELESLGLMGGGVFVVLMIVIQVFYLLSLYTAMNAVPEKHHKFPSWFVWMMIIPIVGFIFSWIMVPFGVPKTMEAVSGDNQAMLKDSKNLFGLGLAQMILFTLFFIPILGWISCFVGMILWIIYWVQVVSFKNTYLINPSAVEQDETKIEDHRP